MEELVELLRVGIDFLIFSKLCGFICQLPKKENHRLSLFLTLLLPVFFFFVYLFYLESFSNIWLFSLKLLFPLFIYGYIRKVKNYPKPKVLFLSFLLSLLYNSTYTFLSVVFSSIIGDGFVAQYRPFFFLVVFISSYFLLMKIMTFFKLNVKTFDKTQYYPFLNKIFFVFVGLHFLLSVSDFVSIIAHLNSFGSILATIVFIGMLVSFFSMSEYRTRYEKEIALKQKKFEQKQLKRYTDEIVGLYNEIRGFRHDYAGMLVSLQMAIDSGNLQEIDRIYNEVLVKANQKLRSDKYTYFDLNNIEDSALRSVIAQSIVYARDNGVEFTLEVKDIINQLSIELLDLVRMMSILLNNAVEGATDSYLKQMEVAVIKMDVETIIVIQNSCKIKMVSSEDLFELGFSTKGRHRGLGLNNVKEILDKYEDIILETEMEDNTFRQIIRFKRELE